MDIISKPLWSKKLKFPKISYLIDISKWWKFQILWYPWTNGQVDMVKFLIFGPIFDFILNSWFRRKNHRRGSQKCLVQHMKNPCKKDAYNLVDLILDKNRPFFMKHTFFFCHWEKVTSKYFLKESCETPLL